MPRGTEVKKTYLNVSRGKIVERLGKSEKRADQFDEAYLKTHWPNIDVKVREILDTKTKVFQKTVFEQIDDHVTAFIEKASIESTDFGPVIRLDMNDGDEKFVLSITRDTSTGLQFMKVFPSINPEKMVKVHPWKSDKGEGIVLSQDDNKLEAVWTKDDPGDYPAPPSFVGDIPYANWTAEHKDDYKLYKMNRTKFLSGYFNAHAEMFGTVDMYSDEAMQQASDKNAGSREISEEEAKQGQKPNTQVHSPDGSHEVDSSGMEEDDQLPF